MILQLSRGSIKRKRRLWYSSVDYAWRDRSLIINYALKNRRMSIHSLTFRESCRNKTTLLWYCKKSEAVRMFHSKSLTKESRFWSLNLIKLFLEPALYHGLVFYLFRFLSAEVRRTFDSSEKLPESRGFEDALHHASGSKTSWIWTSIEKELESIPRRLCIVRSGFSKRLTCIISSGALVADPQSTHQLLIQLKISYSNSSKHLLEHSINHCHHGMHSKSQQSDSSHAGNRKPNAVKRVRRQRYLRIRWILRLVPLLERSFLPPGLPLSHRPRVTRSSVVSEARQRCFLRWQEGSVECRARRSVRYQGRWRCRSPWEKQLDATREVLTKGQDSLSQRFSKSSSSQPLSP